jgi:hypothetical protein
MADPVRRHVLEEEMFRIIFEELNSEWLQGMWDRDGDTRSEMIEMIY